MKRELSFDSLGDLGDGAAKKIIDVELLKAARDIIDRGDEDEKPRKVVIEVTLEVKNGMVVASVAAQAKIPPYRTANTQCHANGPSELVFQPLLYDAIDNEE